MRCFPALALTLAVLIVLIPKMTLRANDPNSSKFKDEAAMDAIVRPYDRPDAPGVSLIVIKDGKALYKKGCGLANVEAKIPNTTKTNFRLVSITTLNQMFTPEQFVNRQQSSYGMGWFIDTAGGFRQVSHGGTTVGFRNQILRLPDEKFTVVVLMNRSDGDPQAIANRIVQHYFDSTSRALRCAGPAHRERAKPG
jgi:CubicO group peptidase (beta-lactamase class C family)